MKPLRVLVVTDGDQPPPLVRGLTASHPIELVSVAALAEARASDRLSEVDAVLICGAPDTAAGPISSEMTLLADELAQHRLTGVVLSPGTSGVVPGGDDAFMLLPEGITEDELWGRLAAIHHCRPQLRNMESQVSAMQRLGKQLNEHFTEVDQELRLASRLQRDFLPQRLPEVEDIRFSAMYRPATWVSGDVYDVQRLDETHVGFFVADAVGHGVAAGLLTMFIKEAIVGKRITEDDYEIVSPSDTLADLNMKLTAQELPNCQFVTACCATIDVQTHKVTFARAGHPHPIHITADGQCREVRTVGGLLGVFAGEEYPDVAIRLEPGEKLLIYSDGIEDLIVSRREREDGLGADRQLTSTVDDFQILDELICQQRNIIGALS